MNVIATSKVLGAWIQTVLVAFAVFLTGLVSTFGQVPAADVTVLPVITDNLPVIGATTAYQHTESEFATNTNFGLPLYMPYNGQTDPKFWDYLVQEQQQARIPVIMLISAGYPWNGNGVIPNGGTFGCNPYYIPQYMAALQRAGLSNTVKFGCCAFGVQGFYDNYYNLPAGTPVDFGNEDSWTNVWWNEEIGPFFANVPKSMWYRLRGGVPIQFWGLSNAHEFTNQQGNLSRFFNFISNKVMSTYGVPVTFDICDTATNYDTTLQTLPHVMAMNPWFNVNTGYGFTTSFSPGLPNLATPTTVGTLIPGFNNGSLIILRNNPAGTGTMGDTFKAGLDAAVAAKADLASIEGWVDPGEGCASYRCSTESVTSQSGNWLYPNQYVNMTRTYADLRTSTLKLEAESCDKYNDPGGTGGVFRRNPSTLDCAALSTSGWVVSNTKAGEWLEWDGVTFTPGNYKFPVCYSSTAPHTLQLQIDGTLLPSVQLPSTGGMNVYATAYLGTKAISNGAHTIKLLFIDGGPNVDWIFLKKSDPQISLLSAYTNKYVTASLGGNSTLVSTQSLAGAWEYLTVDDLAATTGTINSGDTINLQSYNGLYVTAEGGGASNVSNNRRSPGSWETFTIVKVGGTGALTNGTQVAFKSVNGNNYLTVERDGTIDATGTSIGLQQTFAISISQLATPPAAPSNLVATAAAGPKINLTWTNNATNASAFVIERSTDGGKTYAPIGMVAGNVTSYSDTGLPGSTPYMYEVFATNATARSDFTEPASATTLSGPPGAPADLVSSIAPAIGTASTVLNWTASPGATSYTIKRATVSQGPYTNLGTTSSASYSDSTGTLNTTYYYVVSATNAVGGSSNSTQVSSKPVAFQQLDIGTGTTSGSGSYAGGVFTLTGSGRDINGSSDVFHYVYLPLYGDCTIIAHLATLSSSSGWAKAGLMMRPTLAANEEYAMMSITPANGTDFQYRLTTGGGTGFNTQIAGVVAPQWVTLTRSGSTFMGSFSPDGFSWYNSKPVTISMSGLINIGLEESMVSTATFDNVLITPNQDGVPAIPTGLAASLIPTAGNSQVQLSWTNIPGAAWYNVLRSTTNGGGPYSNIGSPHTNVFNDTTAVNGTTYYYVVQAVAGTSASANSAQLTVKVAGVPVARTISLQSRANNLWVTAGSAPLIASAASAGTSESFTVVDESGTYGAGAFALRAQANSLYVTANSTTALSANSSTVGLAQVFYWNDYGNGVISFSSLNNQRWVCADNTGTSPLIANRTIPGAWESYNLKLW